MVVKPVWPIGASINLYAEVLSQDYHSLSHTEAGQPGGHEMTLDLFSEARVQAFEIGPVPGSARPYSLRESRRP
jgi:hypothetical protein